MGNPQNSIPKVPLSALGSTRMFAKDPIAFIMHWRKTLGDKFWYNIANRKVIVMATPEAAKHVLQMNQKNYVKDEAYMQLSMLLGKGLVTNEGESWFKQRRLAQPAFYKESLKEIFNIMGQVMEEFLIDFKQQNQAGQSLDIHRSMMQVTLEAVMRSLFTTSLTQDVDKLHHTLVFLQEHVITRIRRPYMIPIMWLNGDSRRFRREYKVIQGLVLDVINQRRASGEHKPDLLGMFMDARDADTQEQMDEQQLIDECITMVGAGHETSANALAWTFHLLSTRPEIQDRIRAEANAVCSDKMPSFEDLMRMPYSRQVIEEAMRLYPPAWTVGRKSLQDDIVDGAKVSKGEILLIPIYAIHHDGKLWDNPELFNPDRFESEQAKKHDKYQYFPFGAGPRMCIGNNFALMEMQLILSKLVQQYHFTDDASHIPEYQALITLRSKNGVKVFAKPVA